MVCRGNGDMSHISGKERKSRLHVLTTDVALPESIHGKGMADVMGLPLSVNISRAVQSRHQFRAKPVPV